VQLSSGTRSRHPLQPKKWGLGSLAERFEAIRPYVTGKRVLDVGAATGYRRADWMHAMLRDVATSVVGIDLDEAAVAAAQGRGADIRVGNAESFDLGETFEVVWAGELIEHLSNVGLFLDSARRHLEPGGSLVLTTPNAFGVSNFVYRLGAGVRVNNEHTCWFCEHTLRSLLERHGFDVRELRHLGHDTPGSVRRLASRLVRSPLPDRLALNTLLAVASPR